MEIQFNWGLAIETMFFENHTKMMCNREGTGLTATKLACFSYRDALPKPESSIALEAQRRVGETNGWHHAPLERAE